MIRRPFVRALSGAILTTLLGVLPWRPQEAEWEEFTVEYNIPDGCEWYGWRFAGEDVVGIRVRSDQGSLGTPLRSGLAFDALTKPHGGKLSITYRVVKDA